MATKLISKSPIGVFDSGLGGLTVLKSLEKYLPMESFIYFGDTAHVPYGNKSDNAVLNYSKNILDFFLKHNIKAAVIACNTASAVACDKLRNHYDIPIFDVVSPAVSYAHNISITRKIGVIGTNSTICSKAYTQFFIDIKSDCHVIERPCPLFVPLIEEGWSDMFVAKDIAHIYLNSFNKTDIDTLILGCTHYPIISKIIQKIVGNRVQLVYSGKTVGNKLMTYLEQNNCKNNSENLSKTQFYVTDFPQKFDELGSRFLGRKLEYVNHIQLH